MTCTVAAVIATLGFMPPKGTEIVVPRSALHDVSIIKQTAAKACARRYGIKWRIGETK
jgi:hypothetical protein